MKVVPSEISKELTTVVISDGITTISENAFAGCTKLSAIELPKNIESIGAAAFKGCSLLSSEINLQNVEVIPNEAFSGCTMLANIIFPETVQSIGAAAFKDCENLESDIQLNALSSIESELFSGCKKLKKISISSSSFITREADNEFTIGNAAFSGCSALTELTLPETVTEIGDDAFNGCANLSSSLSFNSLTSIGNNAFKDCSSLTTLNIGEKVESVGENAFAGCSELASTMNFPEISSFNNIGNNAFDGCGKIPSGKVGTFSWSFSQDTSALTFTNGGQLNYVAKEKLPWQAVLTNVKSMILGDGMTEISKEAFSLYKNVETLSVGKNIESIAERELNRCPKLSYISVASGNRKFQSIDGVIFTKADYPTLVRYPPSKQDVEYKIPAKVVEISDGAFADCSYLRVVKFCGKLNNYKNADVVTGTSFEVVVSPEFDGDTFFGRPTEKSLTEEDCPRETTTSSSKSNVGVIVGCVCGAIALFALVVVVLWFKTSSNTKKSSIEMEGKDLTSNSSTLTFFFDENYVKRYKELQANKHDHMKEIEFVGSLAECDKQVVSFNQSEDVANLLMLGTNYRSDFTLTSISEKELKLNFFISGCAEPHEVVFEPVHVSLSPNDSQRVAVSIKFHCSANLSPEKVKICGEVENTGEWGAICGIEANTDITRIISCDNLNIRPRCIGSGSYANVYRGKYNGETVAVKEYTTFSEANNIEAQNFAKFTSQYIVKLYGVCYSLNALVLEYCPYGSIEACYGNPELDDEVKKMACYDLAKAMNYLHENNYIHRDLKPDNLLMISFSHDLEKPRGKLSDFGTSQTALKQTKLKSIEGTPAFLAPEVLTGQYDKRCDVYSFGLSVWSILTEMLPYEDSHFNGVRTEEEFYRLIADGVRPSLDAVGTWRELIEMCWQQSPELRPDFGSILQMIENEFGVHIETPASSDMNDNMLSKTKVVDGEKLNKTKLQDVDLNKTKAQDVDLNKTKN